MYGELTEAVWNYIIKVLWNYIIKVVDIFLIILYKKEKIEIWTYQEKNTFLL